jgi:hypothetical protein
MFFIVGLITLANRDCRNFGTEAVVLMVFAFPVAATVYGVLTLIVCNLVSSWLGWPELSLPWWLQKPGRARPH